MSTPSSYEATLPSSSGAPVSLDDQANQLTQAEEEFATAPDPEPVAQTPPPPAAIEPQEPVQLASAANTGRGLQRLVPSNPQMRTVAYPRMELPREQSGAMPQSELACRRELKRVGVQYTDIAPINDGGGCGVAWPVKVSGLSGGISMKPAATLNCQMALAFAQWTKSDLAPAARTRYLSGVKAIHQGSSYSCRKIRGTAVASEHSKGNALDVMRIELNNGRDINVRKPGLFAFRQRSLLNNVRGDACSYFSTVLGPGYNADHWNHFHFDLKSRRNGYRACR
ncbi:extensin family protein [Limoniibacter endophyticus]|uniref:Extensin n=1 Tax=Limoniibacter endophyticus TaxID=1565040 RepID=A0A8J3GHF2_9HYPH|nr:extensin [Limoniibacter endophyticus]